MITSDLENVVVEDSAFYLNGKEVFGIVLARVLCPQNLFYTFLMLRNENSGKVTLPVCRLCSEIEARTACTHSIRYVSKIPFPPPLPGRKYILFI